MTNLLTYLYTQVLVVVHVVHASFFTAEEGNLHFPLHPTTQQIDIEYMYFVVPLVLLVEVIDCLFGVVDEYYTNVV
jgi:hypothetical protein